MVELKFFIAQARRKAQANPDDHGVKTSLTDEKLVPGFGPPQMT